MKKMILFLLILLLCFFVGATTTGRHEITKQKIIDINSYSCDDECGNLSSYEIINIDTFKALYAKQNKRMEKVGFRNLKLTGFDEDAIRLENNEYQWLYAVTFSDENMEELLNHKNQNVNVYGHVREDTRYGWGIIIDVIEFL